jgi:DNA-binding winged helix-turn-helix (wHTH) protein/tetratricopeptide (TPR) repeat protein
MHFRPETTTARFRFGAHVLDPARRELLCDGVPRPMPARAFECLHYLIAHRDRAVGRDELVRAVFGRRDVSDAQLAQIVLRARRAIGDDGQEQRAIRTVPRFGFRWAAEVTVVEDAGVDVPVVELPAVAVAVAEAGAPEVEASPAIPSAANDDHPAFAFEPAPATVRRPRRRRLMSAAIALSAVLALLLGFNAWPTRTPATANAVAAQSTLRNAIIVLPMQVDGQGTAAWARLGMMDFLVDRLRRANLPVWSSEATLALLRSRAQSPDAQRVRRDTAAAWIVESRAKNLRNQWQVALTATDATGRVRRGAAQDADLVAATRQAADRLLAGIAPASPVAAQDAPGLDERLQRAQSALLANDPEAARRLLLQAPAAQRATPQLQHRLAQIDLASGAYATGLATTERLLQSDAVRQDATLRSQLLTLQGALLMRLDRYPDAERNYEQAIALLDTTQDASELGRALIGRGAARMAQQRFDDALADLGRARIQLVRAGDRLSVAKVDGNLGILEMQRDHLQQAVPSFEKAERDFEAMDSVIELAGVRHMLVAIHLQLLQPEKALAVGARAWAMRDRLHDPSQRADLILGRAETLMTVGRLREARALLEMPDSKLASRSDFRRREYLQMELARQGGDMRAAARLGEAALRDWPMDVNTRLRAWVAFRQHEAALAADLPARADTKALSGDPLASQLGAAMLGERADAVDAHYREAVALAEAGGVPGAIANAVLARAHWLMRGGRLDEAAALIGRVAPWAEQDFELALLQVELFGRLQQARQWRASLVQATRLAGERPIPAALMALVPKKNSSDKTIVKRLE